MKTTQASSELVGFVKPFVQVLLNNKYHEKNRMRLLYSLTERIVEIFTVHFSKFQVS